MIGRQQQLLRVDFETAPSHEALASTQADYERLLPDSDIVVLSDYGKGGLAHIAAMIELITKYRSSRSGMSFQRRAPLRAER